MNKKRINITSIAVIIMTIIFLILVGFHWIEERVFSVWCIELGESIDYIDNNVYLCSIVGILSVVMLLLGKGWSLILSTVLSGFNALYTLRILTYVWLFQTLFARITDSVTTYSVMPAGYFAIFVSWIIVILQVKCLISRFSKKGGKKE